MSVTKAISESLNNLHPIPKTMRAGVYREKGIVRVEEVPVPEVGAHEVLIKVAACGICGTGIKKFKPGDRVMSFHHIPCGTCFFCERRSFSQCKQYKSTALTAGFTPNGGGFAQYFKAMPWVS